jgi:D-lactate dehydrogenase
MEKKQVANTWCIREGGLMTQSIQVAVFDTKPYDRQYLTQAAGEARSGEVGLGLVFHEFRLSAETAHAAAGCAAVCAFVNDQLDERAIGELKKLGVRHVAMRCAGFNNVDLKAAKAAGMVVTRVPAYSPHAVAEHTLALLLCLNRKIHRAYNRVREHNFSLAGLVGFDVCGKTVGIVGTGKIGKITAEIFIGFGCKVLAYDVMPDAAWAAEKNVRYVAFDELLSGSDVVSLHSPLTPQTQYMIRNETLEKVKTGVVIINTSRGKLINTSDLIVHLKSGKVAGVALDVYEEEEGVFFEDHSSTILQDDTLNVLLSFPNVLITSHQAFLTHEALTQISGVTTQNLRLIAGGVAAFEGTTL